MKITFKDAEELKAHAKEKLQELLDAGMEHAKALKNVNAYLTKSEFCSTEGHVLKLTLSDGNNGDDNPPLDGMDAKSITDAIVAGVKEAVKGITTTTSGKATNGGDGLTVEKDDWERLLETKRTGKELPNFGFNNLGEFGMALFNLTKSAQGTPVDPRLKLMRKGYEVHKKRFGDSVDTKATPTTYASELVGADGGFMVPPEYRQEVWIAIRDEESILSMCDLSPTNSNVVNMVADQNLPWDNTSGIITGWRAQGTTMSQSKPVIQNRQTQLNEIYALVPVTDETIQDTPQMNQLLSFKAPQKIGYQIDEAIYRGGGNGTPLGFLNSPALVTVTSTSTTLTYTPVDLANMLARLVQPNMRMPKGCWIMTPRAYAYAINLNLGTLGFPLAVPNQTIASTLIPTILGMPVYQSQHNAAFTSAGDVLLVDLKSGYAAYNKTDGIDFQTSMHLFFDSGCEAFRWRFRIGGEPYLKSVIVPANDTTATQSHFVALGAR